MHPKAVFEAQEIYMERLNQFFRMLEMTRVGTKGKKSRFTAEEDAALRLIVKELGESAWPLVAARLPPRNPRQCRDRWNHYLRGPSVPQSVHPPRGEWPAVEIPLTIPPKVGADVGPNPMWECPLPGRRGIAETDLPFPGVGEDEAGLDDRHPFTNYF
jgi:hypothetical protein